MEIKEISVVENGRETKIFIPQSDDTSYNDYLAVAEVEKTREQMKKRPPSVPTHSKADVKGTLTEYRDFQKRQRTEFKRKYF